MDGPAERAGVVADTPSLVEAAKTHQARLESGPWSEIRGRLRHSLNIVPRQRLYVAGEQPLLFGGPLKVLGKLLTLRHLKSLDPDAITLFLIISSDAAQSNRECYRTFLLQPGRGAWHGFRKSDFFSGVPCYGSAVDGERLRKAVQGILDAYGHEPCPPWLEFTEAPAPVGLTLAGVNRAFLSRVAEDLELAPDIWLEDWEAESQRVALNIDLMSRLLDIWRVFRSTCNVQGEPAPFWLIPAGRPRQTVDLKDGKLFLQGELLPLDEMADGVREGRWRLAMRAISRVLVLSMWADAQVSGSGSSYNNSLEQAGAACGQPVMPRWRWPSDDGPVEPPPFGNAASGRRRSIGMLDYLLTTDRETVRARLDESARQSRFVNFLHADPGLHDRSTPGEPSVFSH